MFILRRDGTYVDYHARDPKLLFVPPSEFVGRKVRDVLPPPLGDVMYQYVVAGRSPAASTRQVWSASASARTRSSATTLSKASSSATSTRSGIIGAALLAEVRVHRRTLSGWGSLEATPCAKRSRRSVKRVLDGRGAGAFQAIVAFYAFMFVTNRRCVTSFMPLASLNFFVASAWPKHTLSLFRDLGPEWSASVALSSVSALCWRRWGWR
jgi:hypothetical protein